MAWRCGGLAARCRCEKCGHDDVAHIEFKTIPQAIRDLNLWEQPVSGFTKLPSIAVRGVTTGSTLSPRSNARTYRDYSKVTGRIE